MLTFEGTLWLFVGSCYLIALYVLYKRYRFWKDEAIFLLKELHKRERRARIVG